LTIVRRPNRGRPRATQQRTILLKILYSLTEASGLFTLAPCKLRQSRRRAW